MIRTSQISSLSKCLDSLKFLIGPPKLFYYFLNEDFSMEMFKEFLIGPKKTFKNLKNLKLRIIFNSISRIFLIQQDIVLMPKDYETIQENIWEVDRTAGRSGKAFIKVYKILKNAEMTSATVMF